MYKNKIRLYNVFKYLKVPIKLNCTSQTKNIMWFIIITNNKMHILQQICI